MSTDTCDGCGATYKLSAKTCRVIRHRFQPWFDYLHTICPNCKYVTRIFVEQVTANAVENSDTKILIIVHDFADDETVESACRVYGITLLKEKELTPREEKLVMFFRYLLEGGEECP